MATKIKTETIAFKVDPELKHQAELLAEEDSSNVSIIARKALQFYVSQNKSPINTKSATRKAG
jgi:predicted transcriptional regulator